MSYLPIATCIMNKAWEVLGATQFCNGFCLTHHPAHTLQLAILEFEEMKRKKSKLLKFRKYHKDCNFTMGRQMNFGLCIGLVFT